MSDTAVVDPKTLKHHFVVYVLFFFDDSVIRYVGITQFEKDRAKQHYQCMSGAPRVVQARIAYGQCRSKVVAGLYATLREAQALETYLMRKFDTLVKETKESIEMRLSDQNPKRLPWPDVSLYPDVPASHQLNCKPSVSMTKYLHEIRAAGKAYEAGQTPAPELTDAQQKELHTLVESHWAGEEWLTTGQADDPCGIVFDVDTPFAQARELKEQYEDMPAHAFVDRELVAGQLYTLRKHSLGDEDADAEVAGMVRLWEKTVHPDNQRLKGKPLTAGYAAALFGVAYQWCGEFEESLLLTRLGIDTATAAEEEISHATFHSSYSTLERNAVLRALTWRRWTEANEGLAPKEKGRAEPIQPEQAKVARALIKWRNGNGADGSARRFQSMYLLLLRHYHWFAYFVRGEFATGGDATCVARDVNRGLQLGFGTTTEVKAGLAARVFQSTCSVCGYPSKKSKGFNNFLNGQNAALVDVYLKPGGALTLARVEALRALHESNTEKSKARGDEATAKTRAAVEASGRSKKPRVEAAGATSE